MKISKLIFGVTIAACVLSTALPNSWAYWVWSPEAGKFVNPEGGAAQDEAEEQFNYAMRFYNEKNYEEAVKQLESLLKQYKTSRVAGEAQYRLGTIFEDQGDYLKAFEAYRKLVKSYPQSDRFTEVIERDFRIANLFASGQKAKIMGLEILPAQKKAAEIFKHIVEVAPYSEFGDKAQFNLGLSYKEMGRFQEASEAFQAVIDQYPQSELVAKARFQLADTSYERSASQFRDQRALDDAEKNVDRFLARYPDQESSEKAVKLRQVIDEKNAEKNYRVGRYYEKQNYLKSALIYYEDVAVRYPNTVWGKQASERLQALEKPAEYLSSKEKGLADRKTELETQLKQLPKEDSSEREQLENEWNRLDDQEKSLDREKKDSLKRRDDDIRRREDELKQRVKNLEKKRKAAVSNQSEDFNRAMARWQAALVAEQEALNKEKMQLKEWHSSLGVSQKPEIWESIPFVGGEAPTEIEKIRQVDAKKLYQLAEEKKSLFEEKETLYRGLDEVSTLLRGSEIEQKSMARETSKWIENFPIEESELIDKQQKLKQTREELDRLDGELKQKEAEYERQYGESKTVALITAPVKVVTDSTKVVAESIYKTAALINPFDDDKKADLEEKDSQELLAYRMELKEKIAAQQSIVQTLAEAFDATLAIQEQEKLMKELESTEAVDPHQIRKQIKALEKEVRSNYEEIEDRNNAKNQLIEELKAEVKIKKSQENMGVKSVRAITGPVVGTGKAFKSFIFGSPNDEEAVSSEVKTLTHTSGPSERMEKIREEIELHNLMIQAKSEGIKKKEKELEMVKAKASLAGGFKFRSALVDVPYQFIGGAIDGAKKMIPHKEREEILIQRLDQESGELEAFKTELAHVEKIIEQKTGKKPTANEGVSGSASVLDRMISDASRSSEEIAESKPEAQPKAINPEKSSDTVEAPSKREMNALMKQIESKQLSYEREKNALEEQLKSKQAVSKEHRSQTKIDKMQSAMLEDKLTKLIAQQETLEKELLKLIRVEIDLESKESQILEKRISRIDRVIQEVQSKATSQDLLHEREKMEGRLSQIELRQNFLSGEMDRFKMADRPTN